MISKFLEYATILYFIITLYFVTYIDAIIMIFIAWELRDTIFVVNWISGIGQCVIYAVLVIRIGSVLHFVMYMNFSNITNLIIAPLEWY